ncbi:MAG: nitroreductase [Deltaproteobacteria bacterium]|nr:nitroreductase [Deltaproteobacteria bacterium]
MELIEGIYTRRSVRDFTDEPVKREDLEEIMKAGTWAPSGQNNQPWRFAIIQNKNVLKQLGTLTRYQNIVSSAAACIAVFIDYSSSYDDVKDHMAVGACIQNMLLAAHSLGLGSVWLGEILKNADKVRAILEIPEDFDLLAVVAIGHPAHRDQKSHRKDISELLLKEV